MSEGSCLLQTAAAEPSTIVSSAEESTTGTDRNIAVADVAALRPLARRYSRLGTLAAAVRRRRLFAARWLAAQGGPYVGRTVDVVAAVGLSIVALPLGAMLWAGARMRGRRLEIETLAGRGMRTFQARRLPLDAGSLACRLGLDRLPRLWNVVRGDMTLVGPRAVRPEALDLSQPTARRRQSDRPGLVSPWWVRRRANIAYESELQTDAEYVDSSTLRGDLGIALRSLPAALFGDSPTSTPRRVSLLGIQVDNLTMDDAVARIVERLEDVSDQRFADMGVREHDAPYRVAFVNADCANLAARDDAYRGALRTADLVLADGIGMKLAGRLLGRPVRENVNGTDLFPRLCGKLAGSGARVFLLGAAPLVAADVGRWMAERFPHVDVCGARDGYWRPGDEAGVVREIAAARPDLLLVALGAPRQEAWLRQHLADTGARVGIGVGGLFDFYSGRTPRAPQWVRELGMEWLYRLAQEPGRLWRRYLLGNTIFLGRVVAARLAGRRDDPLPFDRRTDEETPSCGP